MILILIACGLLIAGVLVFLSFWLTHLDQNKKSSYSYAWGTFSQFKKQFAKYTWTRDENFRGSFFHEKHNENRIHADIIRFDSVNMVLYPVDYKGIRHRLISYISRLYEQNGFKSICFVGHSYGGALAAQGALDVPFILGIDPMNVSLVTFGAPRMGNGAFVRALKECVPRQVNYIYGADVIPSLPLWIMGYRKYKNTVRLGKRSLSSVVKNSLTVGLSMLRAKIKKEPFDYFQFMVASDHVLGVFDGGMEVEV